jgi:hypothetical protein
VTGKGGRERRSGFPTTEDDKAGEQYEFGEHNTAKTT